MPQITPETAREMQARSAQARTARTVEAAKPPQETEFEQKKLRVMKQIEKIDEAMNTSPMKLWPALTQAKARLWELLYPKPGSLKPIAQKPAKREGNPSPSEPQ